jgi:hypothetical protein
LDIKGIRERTDPRFSAMEERQDGSASNKCEVTSRELREVCWSRSYFSYTFNSVQNELILLNTA